MYISYNWKSQISPAIKQLITTTIINMQSCGRTTIRVSNHTQYKKLIKTVDIAEQSEIRRIENLREIDLCWEIPIPTPAWFLFWTPWLKGYAGEVSVGPDPVENSGVLRYVWVDQDLKEEITGQKD